MSVLRPWQVWWTNLDPTRGREQAGQRPVVIVSSSTHLALTGANLLTVLPLTTRQRPGWLHRVVITSAPAATGFVITEQIRTIARTRISGSTPAWELTPGEITAVQTMLRRMIDL